MRTPSNNPFLPGSDRVPEIWAGRAPEIADFRDVLRPRRVSGLYERGRAVLGEFGIGKSALINRIAADAAVLGDWVPARVRVAVDADVFDLVGRSLQDFLESRRTDARVGRSADGLLRRIEEVRLPAGGVRIRAGQPQPNAYRTLLDVIVEMATMAGEEGRLLLIRVDEVQNIGRPGPLSQLLTVFGDALEATRHRRDVAGIDREDALPLAIYLSGLPDFHRHAAESGATFSRRFRTAELEPLSDMDLREALSPFTGDGWRILTDDGTARVVMDTGVVEDVIGRSLGDPFLFQLAGEGAWNAGTGTVITREEGDRGWQTVRREVERYVQSRLDGLTDLQMEVLTAAAGLGAAERTGSAVAQAVGRTGSAQIASTTRALDVEHQIIRRQAGRITFRSPAVEAFLAGSWP
ncbi:ATP-binding protein [Euzebya rosea]|uniref:ATP-binding protein n=1 Tax=Euzebya rosea TaxID=2052804 RepID=UPI000D3E5839|nr:ATP-binding protein [Euzebya rosea]